MESFEKEAGLGYLGNKAASGTEIIKELGEEHIKTGRPIIYTSADSVFQIPAHEEIMPVERLYEICRIARGIADRHNIGRVIARPFTGAKGSFRRTERRKDFSLAPTGDTLLDKLKANGFPVTGIGKICDIYGHRGLTHEVHTKDNMDGVDKRLPEIIGFLKGSDMFIITADHGCDPTTPSTDHSREYVPLLVYGKRLRPGINLGTRKTFADIGQTIAEAFGIGRLGHGDSFLRKLTIP